MIAAQSETAQAVGETDWSRRLEELGGIVSASRLSLWLQCSLRFYFRYVLQIRKSPTPAMYSGSTVHAVLQHWNLKRWRDEPLSGEQLKRLFAVQWSTSQREAQVRWQGGQEAERASAWRALEHYFSATPIRTEERPEAVEVSVQADLSRQGLPLLVGIIDLIRPGGRVVDFKVVGKTPEVEKLFHIHEVQLTCYSLLYRDATGRKESGMELHHLVKTKTPKLIVSSFPAATHQQHLRLFRQIESYQARLARQEFVPSPGFHCASCPYFEECRTWC